VRELIGAVVEGVSGGTDASLPSGETRIARPVLPSRIPATHSARPAEARASAGRSTCRRISVSSNITTRTALSIRSPTATAVPPMHPTPAVYCDGRRVAELKFSTAGG
jgi:hypothetical protein